MAIHGRAGSPLSIQVTTRYDHNLIIDDIQGRIINNMQAAQLLELAQNALKDLKACDITEFNVTELTSITDFMIICTGTSSRHVKSISDHLVETLKQHQVHIIGVEGERTAEWILVDAGDIIVHVMQAETRDFYQLEKLWGCPKATTKNAKT